MIGNIFENVHIYAVLFQLQISYFMLLYENSEQFFCTWIVDKVICEV